MSNELKTKKTQLYITGCKIGCKFCKTLIINVNCGVAENRTRVQTSNRRAFYTLSFLLNFRLKARLKTTTFNLALPVQYGFKALPYLGLLLRFSKSNRHKPRLLWRIQLSYLIGTWQILL